MGLQQAMNITFQSIRGSILASGGCVPALTVSAVLVQMRPDPLYGGAVCRAERFSVGIAEPATGQISTPKRRLAVVRNAVANSIG